MYKLLIELEQNALLDKSIKQGVISTTVLIHKNIYELYLLELQKFSKPQAVSNTSIQSNVTEAYIYRIVKKMES